MKFSPHHKYIFIEAVSFLYILLFVYAAISKLLDFENFQVQLGQSPLLSAFAGIVSWAVPIIELLIAGLLLFSSTRFLALWAAFSLMTVFTAYIFIILNYSPFVPCSCGGILEKMGWQEHFIFNLLFMILAAAGILILAGMMPKVHPISKPAALASAFTVTMLLSIGIVTLLFIASEDIIHHRNNFVRRFPKHPTAGKKTIQLPHAAYYIAGYDKGQIYLGNRTEPLSVTILDTSLAEKKRIRVDLPKHNFSYTVPRLAVKPPYFYFSDGNVPCIFIGDTVSWKAELKMKWKAYFSILKPIDNNTAVIRAIDSKTKNNTLGLFTFNSSTSLKLNGSLLQKQVDGIFDTDGSLLYNSQLDKIIYTYAYRNEFLIIDSKLGSHTSGHTIDTTSYAQVSIASIKSKNIKTLAGQPKLVNKLTASFGSYLFVNAALIGKYEPEIMWKQASIIDVYNLKENTYAFSFYVYNIEGRTMDEFVVLNDRIVSLNGRHLTVEKLKTNYYKPFYPSR
ncbi:MauE/DoxX family redox-associated membrane protein [Flavobacterium sp. YJ01]|uniref:MauE/DoxX family redox-associated membrane protein n=1 Tax=Flavobacterium sp. YJ01 TaxID=3031997 RepID=UPI0023E38F76|nr:MauE/DoxX family redox-associated membrane protein [Flavobacterium sp. YJ01]WET03917.1 MauE/DoxX family redox-associated membrane protein [Flavobacterium sp. YJ01]